MPSILVVCTGNLCRSPAGELLLRSFLPDDVRTSSAGTHAVVGEGVHPLTAAALAERGLSVEGHAARQLTAEQVAGAGLVLGMTREHRAAAVRLHPPAASRAYTLAELARLAAALPAGEGSVTEISALRGLSRPRRPVDDDIPDPIGQSPAVHRTVVEAIAAHAQVIAHLRLA